MNYCFLSNGPWENNSIYMRYRELGSAMIDRAPAAGVDLTVTYMVEDVPGNSDRALRLHPAAKVDRVPGTGFGQIRNRRRRLKELRPDFVHVLNAAFKSYLTLAGLGGVRVVADWDEWPVQREHLSWQRRKLEKFLDRWARRRGALVVVSSKYMQQEFRKLGTEALYLPYATYLQQNPDDPNPFTEPTATYMGTMYAQYDVDVIFDALLLLRERGLRPHTVFVGGGPDLERWRSFVREKQLDHVEVKGFLPEEEMWRNIKHARVLLFPIRTNMINLCRCPSKTFAYAQARRPTITSPVGEVPQVLGDKATYVDSTPQAFADAMARAMDPAAPMSDVDYDMSNLTWSRRADVLLDALKRRS